MVKLKISSRIEHNTMSYNTSSCKFLQQHTMPHRVCLLLRGFRVLSQFPHNHKNMEKGKVMEQSVGMKRRPQWLQSQLLFGSAIMPETWPSVHLSRPSQGTLCHSIRLTLTALHPPSLFCFFISTPILPVLMPSYQDTWCLTLCLTPWDLRNQKLPFILPKYGGPSYMPSWILGNF